MATRKLQLPPFDTIALGAITTCRPDLHQRQLHGFIIQVIGTGGPTIAEYFEYFTVNQDEEQKCLLNPALQRKLDNYLNSNSDTLADDFIYIPLTRPGLLFSPWDTGDISRLTIQGKIVGANPGGKTMTRIRGWYAFTPVGPSRPRGDVIAQSVIPVPAGVGGWNELADLEVKDVVSITRGIFDHDAIREVQVFIGDTLVYDMTRDAAYTAMRHNAMYKVPAGANSFPVILDDLGMASDFMPLVEGGVRRPLNVKYFWDVAVTPVPVGFNILFEGVIRGKPAPVANARA